MNCLFLLWIYIKELTWSWTMFLVPWFTSYQPFSSTSSNWKQTETVRCTSCTSSNTLFVWKSTISWLILLWYTVQCVPYMYKIYTSTVLIKLLTYQSKNSNRILLPSKSILKLRWQRPQKWRWIVNRYICWKFWMDIHFSMYPTKWITCRAVGKLSS